MRNLDFKTADGKLKTDQILQMLFRDFDSMIFSFTEYGTVEVVLDDVFEFSFTASDLLQIKKVVSLLDLKKLDRLTNGKDKTND